MTQTETQTQTQTQTEKQMLPDVVAYVEATYEADRLWSKTETGLHAMYPDQRAYGTAREQAQFQAYILQYNEYEERHTATVSAAWARLKGSSDPLVVWVAHNCGGYKEEARTFLAALPATLDELDDLAEEQGWCNDWDGRGGCGMNFRQLMLDAGVLSDD